jgi:hypothetical protein
MLCQSAIQISVILAEDGKTQMFTKALRAGIFVLLVVQIGTQAAASTVLDFHFSGSHLSGDILFDSTVTDTNPNPQAGLFPDAILSYLINVNGAPDNLGATVFRTFQGTSGDIAVGFAYGGLGGCGSDIDCLDFILGASFLHEGPNDYDLTFYYPAGSLASDGLPATVPLSGPMILRGTPDQFSLNALTSVAPVPEGTSVFFVGAGLILTALLLHAVKARGKHVGH